MTLPNKEQYVPIKTIYILQGKATGKHYSQHGVTFNDKGVGSTTSFNDKEFLIKKFGYVDITQKHWEAKRKIYDKLVKTDSGKKSKSKSKTEPEPEPDTEPEKEDEAEAEESK